jgi:hypothetical protein
MLLSAMFLDATQLVSVEKLFADWPFPSDSSARDPTDNTSYIKTQISPGVQYSIHDYHRLVLFNACLA